MKKIYITGVSGVGKTSILKELKKKKFYTIDIDSTPELCQWQNKKTRKKNSNIAKSTNWLNTHVWICNIKKLKSLLNKKNQKVIITAGITSNQNEYLDLFDTIFLLQAKEKTLLHRISIRTEHDFGKTQIEQKHILGSYKEFEKQLIKKGAIPINTEDSIENITNIIISKINL